MTVRTAVMTTRERELAAEAAKNVRILAARLRQYDDLPPIGFKGGLAEGLLGLVDWLLGRNRRTS